MSRGIDFHGNECQPDDNFPAHFLTQKRWENIFQVREKILALNFNFKTFSLVKKKENKQFSQLQWFRVQLSIRKLGEKQKPRWHDQFKNVAQQVASDWKQLLSGYFHIQLQYTFLTDVVT